MLKVTVIADDLTGAADTGVTFARRGLATRVIWNVEDLAEAEALVVSTETRERTQPEAVARVKEVARHLAMPVDVVREDVWLYKKIDSTLRGHPGAELLGVMEEFAAARALVAPAFPAQGRTTVGGRHYVHGVPLLETALGSTAGTSDVAACLAVGLPAEGVPDDAMVRIPLAVVRQGSQAIAEVLMSDAFRIFVADAETEADLLRLAEAARQSQTQVLCGSAGLARALAQTVEVPDGTTSDEGELALPDWRGRGLLVVAGSRHPATLRQIEALEAQGVPVLRPSVDWFLNPAPTRDPILASLVNHLQNEESTAAVLTTAGLPELPGQGRRLAERLASAVRRILEQMQPAALVLTGGDVAIAVSQALDARALQLEDEVQPGVPWGRLVGGPAGGMPMVTKAGGFGDDGVLAAAVTFLASEVRLYD